MKPPVFALCAVFVANGFVRAADATSPVDAAQRNAPFAPAATVEPEKRRPAENAVPRLQERRFEAATVEKAVAPLAGRRAAVEVGEARQKDVRTPEARRPEAQERPVSVFNQRLAPIATGAETKKPPLVAKYQDSLAAASASNMARFPALDQATAARINRFVFRKNPTETPGIPESATATPAAGGSPLR